MTEDHPFNYENFYGATKIAGEALARGMFKLARRARTSALRYMNVYGPRQDYSRRLHRRDHEDARRDRPRRAADDLRRRQPGVRLRLRRRLRRGQRLRDAAPTPSTASTTSAPARARRSRELAEMLLRHHRLRRRHPVRARGRHVRAATASARPSARATEIGFEAARRPRGRPARADRVAPRAPGRARAQRRERALTP